MKRSLLIKLLTSLISAAIMAFLFLAILYPELLLGFFIIGFITFFIFYLLGGIPVSLFISRLLKTMPDKTGLYILIHMLGGLMVTIVYLLITDTQLYLRELMSEDSLLFYGIGISSGLLFSIIEKGLLKISPPA